jgi:hypothetical protein
MKKLIVLTNIDRVLQLKEASTVLQNWRIF